MAVGSGYTGVMTFVAGLLLGTVSLLVPAVAAAQGYEAVGVRALGMGGAFVGVADDASATFWNPAGLVTGPVFSAVAELGRGQRDLSPVAPGPGVPPGTLDGWRQGRSLVALGTWPLGATFYRLPSSTARVLTAGPVPPPVGTGAELSRLSTTHVGVNVLHTIVSGLHVGTAIKYVHGSAGFAAIAPAPADPLDAADDLQTSGSSRFDLDAGAVLDLSGVRVGVAVRNLLTPEFDTPVAGTRLQLPRQVRAGLSVRPAPGLTVALDSDLTTVDEPGGEWRSLAFGAEQRFWRDKAAVRGGVRSSTAGPARPVLSAGGSLSLRSGMFADGYVAIGLAEDAADAFGVGLRVTF